MIGAGTYRLKRDVRNPSPDKRYKRDWRSLPSWDEGEIFYVEQLRGGARSLRRRGSFQHETVRDDCDDTGKFARIALQLAAVHEDPSDYLDRMGWDHLTDRVLDRLASEGRFTVEDVARVLGYELDGTPIPTGEDESNTEAAAAE